jgi:uncharacterized membrane protein
MCKDETILDPKSVLLLEYEACREGIARFDRICFRIRQWSATITAALAASTIASPSAQENADTLLVIAIILNCFFWFYDAMQKSLQLNFIYRSRRLEAYINELAFSEETASAQYRGIEIGAIFAAQHDDHIFEARGTMLQQSIAPFYILPILACMLGMAVIN